MRKIKVLIVEDSLVVRTILANELTKDPEIEVVGLASNGKSGLSKITQTMPDLVTMDIEMPEMNGLIAVSEIRKTHPHLPIIMFSSLSRHAAKVTLEALARGANDYVTKPDKARNVDEAIAKVRDELIPKIKGLYHSGITFHGIGLDSENYVVSQVIQPNEGSFLSGNRVDVLAIGVSTGGPNALLELLPNLTQKFPIPILIVQHMPPLFTKCLAEKLTSQSHVPVQEGENGVELLGGQVWIAPGGVHMGVRRKGEAVELFTTKEDLGYLSYPSVDVLFNSTAEVFGQHVLGVVLTGMGEDGLRGCESIRKHGGRIFVQDRLSSAIWGMPGAVAKAGLAEKVLPLSQMSSAIWSAVVPGRESEVDCFSLPQEGMKTS